MKRISRRDIIKGALAVPAASVVSRGLTEPTNGPSTLSQFGWIWEGQGFTGASGASIYGLGEGAQYFGLKRAFNLWRANDDLAMDKLCSLEEVVCEITPTRPIHCGERCVESFYDPKSEKFLAEARNVSNLSLKYRNITGAYIDETLGSGEPITRELYASIYNELKESNSKLKLWALVYSEQLYKDDWTGFKPQMDIINLWVWDSKDLVHLDRHLDRCREIFPDKPLVLGCFLWDYPSMMFSRGDFEKGHAVPMDLVKLQWEHLPKDLAAGRIDGYAILGTYLIESAREQALWIRNFIAAN